MQKIVVGIIAVFFVQIGFQVYLAVERTNVAYATAHIPPDLSAGSLADVEDPDSYGVTGLAQGATAAKFRRPQAEPTRRAVFADERSRRAPLRTATTALFKPVVITVPTRPDTSVEKRVFTATTVSFGDDRKKDKSLPKKALAVVKKPFDWLKAVASKVL